MIQQLTNKAEKPEPQNDVVKSMPGKKGLGGWLTVVGIYIALMLIAELISSFESANMILTGSAAYFSSFVPGFFSALLILLVSSMIMFLLYLGVLARYVTKRRQFRTYFMTALIINFIFSFIGYGIFSSLSVLIIDAQGTVNAAASAIEVNLALSVAACVAFGIYIRRSRRVKNTFIEQQHE